MLSKMWNNWNFPLLLLKIQNGTATLENSLAFSNKMKLKLTIWLHDVNFRYLPYKTENLNFHKNLYIHLYNDPIQNFPTQKSKQTLFKCKTHGWNILTIKFCLAPKQLKYWWTHKKKNWDESQGYYAELKQADLKRLHTLQPDFYDVF